LLGLAVVFLAMHATGYIQAEISMKEVIARTNSSFKGSHRVGSHRPTPTPLAVQAGLRLRTEPV
jgi:hypothetical protein